MGQPDRRWDYGGEGPALEPVGAPLDGDGERLGEFRKNFRGMRRCDKKRNGAPNGARRLVVDGNGTSYELGPPTEPLALALAMTDTLMLAEAWTEALAATATQATALPPMLATWPVRLTPAVTTEPATEIANLPWPTTPSMRPPMCAFNVVTSFAKSALAMADAEALTVTEAGVHMALTCACALHEPLQSALAVHIGGSTVPSHFGAV